VVGWHEVRVPPVRDDTGVVRGGTARPTEIK
jgi:hypothetical protein